MAWTDTLDSMYRARRDAGESLASTISEAGSWFSNKFPVITAHIKDQSYRLWLEKFLHWEVDPDFRVTEEDAKLVDPEGRFPMIMNARSLKELQAYNNIIHDLYKQREIKEISGFWKNLGSSFLDPTVLFPCVLGIELVWMILRRKMRYKKEYFIINKTQCGR